MSLSSRALADAQQLSGFCRLNQPPKQQKEKAKFPSVPQDWWGSRQSPAQEDGGAWGVSVIPAPSTLHPGVGVPCPSAAQWARSCLLCSALAHLLDGRQYIMEILCTDEFILNYCKLSKLQQDEEHATNREHTGYFSITALSTRGEPKCRPCTLAALRTRLCKSWICVSPFTLPQAWNGLSGLRPEDC